MAGRKGAIAVGADADLVIWNAELTKRVEYSMLHDATGYTPYEGQSITGWPETVFSRGRVVVQDGELHVARGSGEFLARGTPAPVRRAAGLESPRKLFKGLIG